MGLLREVIAHLGVRPALIIIAAVLSLLAGLAIGLFRAARRGTSAEARTPLFYLRLNPSQEASVSREVSERSPVLRIKARSRRSAISKMPHRFDAFGGELRRLRRARRLTQYDLANDIDVSPTYISEIETGKRIPSAEIFQRIASTLRLSDQELSWLKKIVGAE
jgi:DNA-binding XRE family transcriptional regulator